MKRYFSASLVLGAALLLLSGSANAQVSPTIGQFNYVPLLYNPASAGAVSGIRVNVLHRSHWTSLPGAPKVQLVTLDKPIGRNIGAGLVIMRHKVGSATDLTFDANASYKIKTGENSNFMLGMKAGVSMVNTGLEDEFFWDENDQILAGIGKRGTVLKMGPGVFYKRKFLYAGLSSPDLMYLDLQKVYFDDVNSKSTLRNNFFFTTGTRVRLTEFVSLNPAFMLKYYAGRPVNYFVNLGLEFNQTFTAGVGFVYPMAASVFTRIAVSSKMKLGFRYEMSSKYYNLGSFGSSEIMLTYGF